MFSSLSSTIMTVLAIAGPSAPGLPQPVTRRAQAACPCASAGMVEGNPSSDLLRKRKQVADAASPTDDPGISRIGGDSGPYLSRRRTRSAGSVSVIDRTDAGVAADGLGRAELSVGRARSYRGRRDASVR